MPRGTSGLQAEVRLIVMDAEARESRPWPIVRLLGVPIDALTKDQLLSDIGRRIETQTRSVVLHVNVHAMNFAADLPWFRAALEGADLVFCDGFGVRLGARINGLRIPERMTSADWIWELGATARDRGWRLYLLGGRRGVADRAAQKLRDRIPGITIAGTHHGFFSHEATGAENEAVLESIRAARPDLLLVGFGMPLQERWLTENADRLPPCVSIALGALFDYVSGGLRRAPTWMTRLGLEWLGRLLIEPGRLWRRYLIGNPRFILRALGARLRPPNG